MDRHFRGDMEELDALFTTLETNLEGDFAGLDGGLVDVDVWLRVFHHVDWLFVNIDRWYENEAYRN